MRTRLTPHPMFAPVVALGFLLALFAPLDCPAIELSEYEAKAGFILNLVRFTEWPADATAKTGEIGVCTLGSDPFGSAFESLRGNRAKGKPLGVRHLEQAEDLAGCHLLFIGESERKHLSRILNTVGKRPILTISEVDQFTDQGGMVNLLIEQNKAVLEINAAAVRQANLTISAQVLKLARKVID